MGLTAAPSNSQTRHISATTSSSKALIGKIHSDSPRTASGRRPPTFSDMCPRSLTLPRYSSHIAVLPMSAGKILETFHSPQWVSRSCAQASCFVSDSKESNNTKIKERNLAVLKRGKIPTLPRRELVPTSLMPAQPWQESEDSTAQTARHRSPFHQSQIKGFTRLPTVQLKRCSEMALKTRGRVDRWKTTTVQKPTHASRSYKLEFPDKFPQNPSDGQQRLERTEASASAQHSVGEILVLDKVK